MYIIESSFSKVTRAIEPIPTYMRPKGNAEELERRRRRAVQLMREGESPTLIARILGVSRQSLYRWRDMARAGPKGLAAKPTTGRKRRLSDAQLSQLEKLLLKGAQAYGWANNLWTAPRVTEVVRRYFGIKLHPEHVRNILKQRLAWTSQKPERYQGTSPSSYAGTAALA